MTSNQIAYWSLLESTRHNKAGESETKRHNIQTEDVAYRTLEETARHNSVNERVAIFNAEEAQRHNIATETETNRHNVVSEDETARHNVAQEQLSKYATDMNFASSIYSANKSYEASKYNTDVMSRTSLANTASSNLVKKYASDLSYSASVYGSDTARRNAVLQSKTNITTNENTVNAQNRATGRRSRDVLNQTLTSMRIAQMQNKTNQRAAELNFAGSIVNALSRIGTSMIPLIP